VFELFRLDDRQLGNYHLINTGREVLSKVYLPVTPRFAKNSVIDSDDC